MSTTEAACYSTPKDAGLRVESLPFDRIPHQSRLFLDYLRDPVSLKHFYPSAVRIHSELTARTGEVLAVYRTDRGALCDSLEAMNRAWGAGAETLANIARLRSEKSVAVVTGQQIGLFTGPLYTIYKALSAVKLARCLTGRGTQAVPVFWMATEDHDWDEVRSAKFISCDGHLAHTSVKPELHREGVPVGTVIPGESANEAIQHLLDALPTTEFTPALETLIRDAYQPGRTYIESFARMMTALTGHYGLVLLDPLDVRLKQLAAPLYAEAAQCAPELAAALKARSRELEAEGYHAQVLTSSDSFPLFLHDEKGARRAVARAGDGTYQVRGVEKQKYTAGELAEWAAREPERFSPNVTLRGVVQDFLLPTVAYFGGAAEVAYFAQTAEVYRLLNRPVTPVLHRSSLTLVERRTGRTLERYGLNLTDFFDGLDKVIAHVVEQHLGAETARAFDRTDAATARALDELHEQLRQFDSTLGDALGNGRRKIEYQLAGLRARFHRAQITRDEAVHRQIERANTALYPEKSLQERHVNITSLVARHGLYVVDWIFAAIDPGAAEHQIVYL